MKRTDHYFYSRGVEKNNKVINYNYSKIIFSLNGIRVIYFSTFSEFDISRTDFSLSATLSLLVSLIFSATIKEQGKETANKAQQINNSTK
jgi:hypothetical protein